MKTLRLILLIVFLASCPSLFAGKFVLTHMLGKKLPIPAYFYIGEQKVWELDYRNGDKIYYTILTLNENNLLCGIRAKDNFGDYCKICITKVGNSAIIDFEYNAGTITYKGYYSD